MRARPRAGRLWCALALLGLGVAAAPNACVSGARGEAAKLVSAVDRYRHAPDASKTVEAQAVAAVPCTDAKVCEAKRVCVAALDPTARALALKEEVAGRLRDIEQSRLAPDAPDARALPAKLDDAERLLREGRAKMPECERRLTDLSADYGV